MLVYLSWEEVDGSQRKQEDTSRRLCIRGPCEDGNEVVVELEVPLVGLFSA